MRTVARQTISIAIFYTYGKLASQLRRSNPPFNIVERTGPVSGPPSGAELHASVVLIGTDIAFGSTLRLCEAFRSRSKTTRRRVVVLLSDPTTEHVALAYSAGASDVREAPRTARGLINLIDAVRQRAVNGTDEQPQVVRIGALTIVAESYVVKLEGTTVSLTAGEYRALWQLAIYAGKAVPADRLLTGELSSEIGSGVQSVRTFIFSLRRKLGRHARQLQTVRNVGYALVE
ncbi:MAG TPA: winged helix-turn-helix domain-containing protein [Tepidisphaeraceae bacterium]|jgi:DNA-binding response OmpR family regulator|nr:winged helix-turn-helix domain-containing protein [Tepidisphaeraceae bacterium]